MASATSPFSNEHLQTNSLQTYKVVTWGCQMNEEDSEQMELLLEGLGLKKSESIENASVILLNTCSVRKKPEDKAFSLLGEIKKYKEDNPGIILGVCGCMAQLRADEIKRRAPHVDFVIGTAQVSQIPGLVEEIYQKRRFQKRLELPERKGAVVTDIPKRNIARAPKIKAFVPIQYGCDKFCTFCIVPTTRGRERSRPTEEILDEIKKLAERGTQEVTLLGQTVNSYGKNLLEGRVPFAKLLWRIAEIEGIKRIRYTSPYPRDYKDDLINAHKECEKVMPHVHLPLQSGDDDVLKAMRRVYSVDSFKEIYWNLRDSIPDISITTDIIVGFPGETTQQFQNTLNLVSELRFDAAFMFAYSPRPGTPAAEMDQVDFYEKKSRLKELIDLQNSITCEINSTQVGNVYEVMVEGLAEKQPIKQNDKKLLKGLTRHGKTVHFYSDIHDIGEIIKVHTDKSHLWGFTASKVNL